MNKSKIQELFDFDKSMSKNYDFVIGTDEAGRGPGAGPVFAAAVCFSEDIDEEILEKLKILNDSKQLTEKKRDELFENIIYLQTQGKCICSIQDGSVEQIEKINILNTSLDCMKRACEEVKTQLKSSTSNTLVDGNRLIKNYPHSQTTVVKGDSKSAAIAAASILAKVSRDRFMDKLAEQFPQYNWKKNKGYLSAEHINAIKEFGATKWHRKKFLRKILEEQTQDITETKKNKGQLSLF